MYQKLGTPGAFLGLFSILRCLIEIGVLPEKLVYFIKYKVLIQCLVTTTLISRI